MNKIYVCICCICFCILTRAQNNGSIYGNIVDTLLKQPIPDVTITILDGKDSSLITFGRTNREGLFNIKYLPRGKYRLLATHIGYRNYTRYFEILEDKKEIS